MRVGRDTEDVAGRKRHSAEEIVRKLRRADELAAEGRSGEGNAAELKVSAATLYDWRRQYGGIDTDAARELKELREQNARLKRLLAEAELEKDVLREIAKGNNEPGRLRSCRGHAERGHRQRWTRSRAAPDSRSDSVNASDGNCSGSTGGCTKACCRETGICCAAGWATLGRALRSPTALSYSS
ncbi:transposase [Nocardia sp. NPDC004718]